ncbi:MAG: hypothetical protein M3Q07_16760 [Pseudobdellovibrionaceae bacterium]|nr:hypothetical protein [Pseudobdellovibrionaceae bacterium]
MKKHLSWYAGLMIAFLVVAPSACKDSGGDGDSGNVTNPEPEFKCQYSLVKNETELLRQGHDKAVAGENLESLLKHVEKCLSDAPSS